MHSNVYVKDKLGNKQFRDLSGRSRSFYKSSYGANVAAKMSRLKNSVGPSPLDRNKPLSNYSDHFKKKANLSFFKSQ